MAKKTNTLTATNNKLVIIPPKMEIDFTSSVRETEKSIITGRKSPSVKDSYRPKKKKKSEKKLLLTRRTKK